MIIKHDPWGYSLEIDRDMLGVFKDHLWRDKDGWWRQVQTITAGPYDSVRGITDGAEKQDS